MPKEIIIFLNDKILSLDSILPLLQQLKNKSIKLSFIVFNNKTKIMINENLLLKEILLNLGHLDIFGIFHYSKIRSIRILGIVISCINMIIRSKLNKINYIHFKALEKFPFNLLYKFNNKNTYLFEANCWGYSNILETAYSIFDNRDTRIIHLSPMHAYNSLVSFTNSWPQVNFAKEKNKEVFTINSPRASKNWLEFCKGKSILYKKQEPWFEQNKSKKFVLYLLGSMERYATLKKGVDGYLMLEKTLSIFKRLENTMIIIKPHINANLTVLNQLIKKNKINNIKILYMHTSVLSNYCEYVLCNYMSFALADAWMAGSHTIEFTSYDEDLLKATNNNSIYPQFIDSFLDISQDQDLLNILRSKIKRKNRKYNNNNVQDNTNKLLESLLN